MPIITIALVVLLVVVAVAQCILCNMRSKIAGLILPAVFLIAMIVCTVLTLTKAPVKTAEPVPTEAPAVQQQTTVDVTSGFRIIDSTERIANEKAATGDTIYGDEPTEPESAAGNDTKAFSLEDVTVPQIVLFFGIPIIIMLVLYGVCRSTQNKKRHRQRRKKPTGF